MKGTFCKCNRQLLTVEEMQLGLLCGLCREELEHAEKFHRQFDIDNNKEETC